MGSTSYESCFAKFTINVGAGSQAQGPDKENVTLVTQLKLIHFGRKKIEAKMFTKKIFGENFA